MLYSNIVSTGRMCTQVPIRLNSLSPNQKMTLKMSHTIRTIADQIDAMPAFQQIGMVLEMYASQRQPNCYQK